MLTAPDSPDLPYRVLARCAGRHPRRQGFRADVGVLSGWLGIVATPEHGRDHETIIQHGRMVCYVSLTGDTTHARNVVGQCARGEVVVIPLCDREWIIEETKISRSAADQASTCRRMEQASMGFGDVTTGSRTLHWVEPSERDPTDCSGMCHAAENCAGDGSNQGGACDNSAVNPPTCILCGVSGPANIGSIHRVMACLGFRDVLQIRRPHGDVDPLRFEPNQRIICQLEL